ncbi:MAG: DUF3168 domain-containing protein [Proteobacteria bacterium]|nr:DUF3168 domain-containing protein [Pseudomonadota bacterium]
MEIALRSALIDWLKGDPALAGQINAIVEEAPSRTALPWLAIAASASSDWSAKDRTGREVRVALELHCRGDRPDDASALVAAIEARITALPAGQASFRVVTATFLRARAEQRGGNTRVVLIEYRFRVMAP